MKTMNGSGAQRLIPIALVLIVIIVAIAALISLGRSIFGGGNNGATQPTVDTSQEALLNTALDHSVRMTIRGPIVADENFHSYTITVSPTARVLTTYEGYLDRQVDTKELANNTRGYEQFVHALDIAGIVKGDNSNDTADLRGICATGKVYIFEILQASNTVKKLWTSTCRSPKGTLQVSSQTLANLFQVQIPDYSVMTGKVRL